MTVLEELTRLSSETPVPLRVAIGASGALLALAGARIYKVALFGSVFLAVAVATAVGLLWGAAWLPALARPEVVGLGALVAGVAAAGAARLAHRIALVAAGGVAGVAFGAGLGELLATPAAVWAPLAGGLVGAILFPFTFRSLLKFLTPAVGALAVAFAAGRPTELWILGAVWLVGSLVQLGFLAGSKEAAAGD